MISVSREHLKLPTIYPITDVLLSGISHTEQVRRLIAGGSRFIQIREKEMKPSEWFEDARGSVSVAHAAGAIIIVNDRVDLALAVGADGVHLGQDDLPPLEARKLLGEAAVIGFSTHSLKQAIDATGHPIDYVAIGPIFGTDTKVDADPVVGLEQLNRVKSAIGDLPLVTIGGINSSNLLRVFAAGAQSAAVIGAIVGNSAEIAANYAVLNAIVVNNIKHR